MMKHCLIRAKAHASQTANAYLFLHADDTPLVPGKRTRGADANTLATLDAKAGTEVTLLVIIDADVGFLSIDDLVPGLGAGLLAHVAADAEIRVIGQDFCHCFPLLVRWLL
jgi:hypothetical protein